MKCFLAISLLLLLAKNIFRRKKVIGCVESIQEKNLSSKIKLFQIDFSKSCKNLENCILDQKKRFDCEKNFEYDMEIDCLEYCDGKNASVKKWYCDYVRRNNLRVIVGLPDRAFKEFVEVNRE